MLPRWVECNNIQRAKKLPRADIAHQFLPRPCREICRGGGTGIRARFTPSLNLHRRLVCSCLTRINQARMAELADAHGSEPCGSNPVGVQLSLLAPPKKI